MIIAIDPGYRESGLVVMTFEGRIVFSDICPNDKMLRFLRAPGVIIAGVYAPEHEKDCFIDDRNMIHAPMVLAIEMVASYGMRVGKEIFETVLWTGRFVEAADVHKTYLVYRKDVKLHLCGTVRAKDKDIRKALINIYKAEGKEEQLEGIKSHLWSALAVGVYCKDVIMKREELLCRMEQQKQEKR